MNEIYKDAILATGVVEFGNKKVRAAKGDSLVFYSLVFYSIWITPHSSFQSSCEGRVFTYAESENGESFQSTGTKCSSCPNAPQLNISISRTDIQRKVQSEIRRASGDQVLKTIERLIDIPKRDLS
ncbi:MAG: hypothetical protein AAB521_00115 [Patescibacteria group bacterium]